MVEISSPDDLNVWLRDRPVEWSTVIARRLALRGLPIFNSSRKQTKTRSVLLNRFFIATVRSLLVSEVMHLANDAKVIHAANSSAERVDFILHRTYNADGEFFRKSTAVYITRAANDALYAVLTKGLNKCFLATRATSATLSATKVDFNKPLNSDIQWLEEHKNKNEIFTKFLTLPLWIGTNFLWSDWLEFKAHLIGQNFNWKFWIDWYQSKLDGTLHPGLTQSQQDNLYYQIATLPNELWEDGADAVNQRIAELLKEIKNGEVKSFFLDDGFLDHNILGGDVPIEDFFLSYSTRDEAIAKKITKIIEPKGHTVFAQFKDMPVGSNFITEMQEGLENSSKFICLYSENYWTSDYCQQEWNAAITFDPRGKKRKIIPFLISESAIPPLARPLVYKNLIGLNDEEFQKAVLEAIESDGVITSEQARKVAKETISPEPFINDDQELDIRANKVYDQQRITEDLYNLPDVQITLIDNLIARIKNSNIVPQAIVLCFEQYRDELIKNGVQPNISLLNNLYKLIELDIETSEFDEWKNKQTEFLIEQIGENHTKFQSHFPLDMVREENYRDSPMEVEKFNDDSFYKQIKSLNKVFKELKQEQLATDRFLENRQYEYEQIQQLLNLDATKIIKSDEAAVIQSEKEIDLDNYKKRRLIQAASFADKLSEILEKSDKIIKNPSAKYLSKLAKNLADWLWS